MNNLEIGTVHHLCAAVDGWCVQVRGQSVYISEKGGGRCGDVHVAALQSENHHSFPLSIYQPGNGRCCFCSLMARKMLAKEFVLICTGEMSDPLGSISPIFGDVALSTRVGDCLTEFMILALPMNGEHSMND